MCRIRGCSDLNSAQALQRTPEQIRCQNTRWTKAKSQTWGNRDVSNWFLCLLPVFLPISALRNHMTGSTTTLCGCPRPPLPLQTSQGHYADWQPTPIGKQRWPELMWNILKVHWQTADLFFKTDTIFKVSHFLIEAIGNREFSWLQNKHRENKHKRQHDIPTME